MAMNSESDQRAWGSSPAPVQDSGTARLRRRQALEAIQAGIIAARGSLDGLLDEFLAERRAEARREFGEESDRELAPTAEDRKD